MVVTLTALSKKLVVLKVKLATAPCQSHHRWKDDRGPSTDENRSSRTSHARLTLT
jgi:hypothetical protein